MKRALLAVYLNSSQTRPYFPLFEITHATESTFLLLSTILIPCSIRMSWKAVPLHRNIRLYFIGCLAHILLINLTRFFLLTSQYIDCGDFVIIASIVRREAFTFGPFAFLALACDRLIATVFWKWYEQQGPSTAAAFLVPIVCVKSFSIPSAYIFTYMHEGNIAAGGKLFFAATSTIVIGATMLVIAIWLYSKHQLSTALDRRHTARYSLARLYQLRENVSVMSMMMRMSVPGSILCCPAVISFVLYIRLPNDWKFLRILSIAGHDWWISLSGLIVQLFLPLLDHRFRKSARKTLFLRNLVENRWTSARKDQFVEIHVTQSLPDNSNAYFNWLARDLR